MTDKEKIAQLENDLRLLLKEFSLSREEMTLKVTVLETENKVLKEKLKNMNTLKTVTTVVCRPLKIDFVKHHLLEREALRILEVKKGIREKS